MVHKTYINKFCTIVSGSKANTGLNPVAELRYGRGTIVSRSLLYFDHSEIKKLIDEGIMIDKSKMKHTLHLRNANSMDLSQLHDCVESNITEDKRIRAASFDLIFFLIPKHWDRGKGFDFTKTYLNYRLYSQGASDPRRLYSDNGANWFNRETALPWDEEGVYTNETLSLEYDKWASGEESKVIGRQHFDYGFESVDLDITDVVNKFIDGELENNGIGIAFSPLLEVTDDCFENYVGFFTDKTNTFFAPYVETRYDDVISDDRSNFVLGKDNKLYLYCTIGNQLEDLDANPTVTIRNGDEEVVVLEDGTALENIESTKQTKGVYYINLKLPTSQFEADTMLYDTWGGISYHGSELEPVELDFTLKRTSNFFNIGSGIPAEITFKPSISGIGDMESIRRGDRRKLVINAQPQYTSNMTMIIDSMDIRLYIMDGKSEIDVISWDRINKTFNENFYVLDTNILMPQRYYVDIRVKYGMNSIVHHDVLSFDIANDVTNKNA